MCRWQLWNRGSWPAIGCAGLDYLVGDRSRWPVWREGAGLSKESGASYLQTLLCWLYVALQLNQRGADQSSPDCLQLPANMLWGKMMNERANGQEANLLLFHCEFAIRLISSCLCKQTSQMSHIPKDVKNSISLHRCSLKGHICAVVWFSPLTTDCVYLKLLLTIF